MKAVVYPADWLFRDPAPPLGDFGRRLLAEGDSWFTIGSLNLPAASNLLLELEFSASTAIVSCAYPGDTLQHMVDNLDDPYFDKLLRRRNFASYWEALIISAGGNDLIDAAQIPATGPGGTATPADLRLLLTPAEVGAAGALAPAGFVSDAGFARLAAYLVENFRTLAARRDQGPSAGRPLFLHTYATPTVRPSGTVGAPQGWLYPAFTAYGIPEPQWQPVAQELFGRLRRLLLDLDQGSGSPHALAAVHTFDSASVPGIEAAQPGTSGISGDWTNEIHMSPQGYRKVGKAFGAWMEGVLAGYA